MTTKYRFTDLWGNLLLGDSDIPIEFDNAKDADIFLRQAWQLGWQIFCQVVS